MPIEPPICTQVSVPSSLTNPGPKAAQELIVAGLFIGSTLPELGDFDGFGEVDDCAIAGEANSEAMTRTKRRIRMWRLVSRVAGQPQCRRQRVGAIEDDLGARGGNVLHHALTRREAAIKRDPRRLPQSLPGLPLSRRCHFFPILIPHPLPLRTFQFG